jgi:hypothetical protein
MAKTRVSIPKEIKEKVLKEFSHRCAICGADDPQIHHIDEDPSNNEQDNLIPLCPNHHLTDQHDPTSGIPFYRMKLFREYKDPTILGAQFQPLYKRLTYLFDINDNSKDEELIEDSEQLIKFVSFLEMGEFYSDELRKLLSSPVRVYFDGVSGRESEKEFREQLKANRNKALDLIIELLRYQSWGDNKGTHT